MAEEIKVVDLMAKNPTTKKVDVLVPYNEIELTGGLQGGGHTRSNGKIELNGKPSGEIELEGFVRGKAEFEDNGGMKIDTAIGDWVTSLTNDGQTLNIFRRLK